MIYLKLFTLFFLFLTLPLKANNTDNLKIIELHRDKILDDLVLDSKHQDNNNEDSDMEISNTQDVSEQISENNDTLTDTTEGDNESIIGSSEIINIITSEKIFDLDDNIITNHLESIIDIKSKTLSGEFVNILSSLDVNDLQNNENKFYFIIKKLYEIGEIGKAYNLIKKINIENLSNEEHLVFFKLIELNYLFSRSKLEEVCELNSSLANKPIILPKFFIEKTDIFCLVLSNNLSEAKLQNSLLLDSESIIDENFQKLLNYMFLEEQDESSFQSLTSVKSKELIFLYSSMLRINELPLDEEFINIDPMNLSIPVILSGSTQMSTRIKAANKAFYDDVISIDSLSALYQSADFNSKEFNVADQTILNLNSNELIMAFYYQLANMQIFPDDRLNVILDYWKFARDVGLEKIAYANTSNILESFTPTSENSKFGIDIALAHISNKNYVEASKWINIIENFKDNKHQIDYLKFLIAIHESDDLDTIVNYLRNNSFEINYINNQKTLETLEILNSFLNIEKVSNTPLYYDNIIDDRFMPSYFLIKDIKKNMESEKNLTLFFLSLISMNNKNWDELHPEHLKLILNAYNFYDQGYLIKPIILEILNDLEIIK